MLLDTNALMLPEQMGVDVFSELQRFGYIDCIVPEPVLRELRAISQQADKERHRRAARVGLALAGRCCIIPASGEADDVLEDLAIKEKAAVLTCDKALKKRLSSRGITVIYPRQGRYLEVAKKEF